MLTEPRIEVRPEQPYAGVRASVPMDGLASFIDEALSEVFAHLAAQGVEPAGPPFLRYLVIDMDGVMEMEAGVPVAHPVSAGGRVFAGIVPGGRYGVLTHVGHYDGLVDANESLQRWARNEGLEWAMEETDHGDRFESRLEVYLTDPASEPDPEKWETDVAYLLAQA